jgi:hypothetical protein
LPCQFFDGLGLFQSGGIFCHFVGECVHFCPVNLLMPADYFNPDASASFLPEMTHIFAASVF